jgi:hypothetical protein
MPAEEGAYRIVRNVGDRVYPTRIRSSSYQTAEREQGLRCNPVVTYPSTESGFR